MTAQIKNYENKDRFTSNAVLRVVDKKEINFHVPAYMRLKVKNFTNMDLEKLSG